MSRETKIGLLILASLAVLLYFLVKLGSLSSLFEPKGYEIKAFFQSIAGLEERAPVRLAGVRIGYVEEISLFRGRALVKMKIFEKYRIRRGSRAAVTSMGIMGEKYIEIFPGEGEGFVAPGETVEGIPPLSIDQLGAMFYSIAQDVKKMSKTFSDVIGGERGKASLKAILQNMDRITTRLDKLLEENSHLISTSSQELLATIREAKEAIKVFSEASRRVSEVAARFGDRSRELKAALVQFEKASASLRALSEKLKNELDALEKGSLGRFLRDREIYRRTRDIVEQTSRTLRRINAAMETTPSLTPYLFYSSEGLGKAGLEFSSARDWMNLSLVKTPSSTSYDLLFGRRVGRFSIGAGIIEGEFGLRTRVNLPQNLFLGGEIYHPRQWKWRLLFGITEKNLSLFGGYSRENRSLIFGVCYGR